jgi:hypothetical protein
MFAELIITANTGVFRALGRAYLAYLDPAWKATSTFLPQACFDHPRAVSDMTNQR